MRNSRYATWRGPSPRGTVRVWERVGQMAAKADK